MPSFLGKKSHDDAFGQPAFFLAGNLHLMTSMRVFSAKKIWSFLLGLAKSIYFTLVALIS